MGLNSLLNFFKLDGIDDEYDDYEYDDYEEETPAAKPASSRKSAANNESYEDTSKSRSGFRNSKPKVVSLNRSMMEVKIIQPTSFEDSQEICNTLLSSKPVVVNLEGFDPDDAQRIMENIIRFPNTSLFLLLKMWISAAILCLWETELLPCLR